MTNTTDDVSTTVSIQHLETIQSLLSQLSTFDMDSLNREMQKAIKLIESFERDITINEDAERQKEEAKKKSERYLKIIANLQDVINDSCDSIAGLLGL